MSPAFKSIALFFVVSLFLQACNSDKSPAKTSQNPDRSKVTTVKVNPTKLDESLPGKQVEGQAPQIKIGLGKGEATKPVAAAAGVPQSDAEKLKAAISRYQSLSDTEQFRQVFSELRSLLRDLLEKSVNGDLSADLELAKVVEARIQDSFHNKGFANELNGYFPMIYRNLNRQSDTKLIEILSEDWITLHIILFEIVHVWADKSHDDLVAKEAKASYRKYVTLSTSICYMNNPHQTESLIKEFAREGSNALAMIHSPLGASTVNEDYLAPANIRLQIGLGAEIYPLIGNEEVLRKSPQAEQEKADADSAKAYIRGWILDVLASDKVYLNELIYEEIVPALMNMNLDALIIRFRFKPALEVRLNQLKNQLTGESNLLKKAQLVKWIFIVEAVLSEFEKK